MASISSKNMMQGLQALARLKIFLTAFYESPTYFEKS